MAIAPARRSDQRTIVVVGAGIGGLTAALALAAAKFDVVVVERSAELSEVGAGVQIAPNAGRVLAKLGLEAAVAAKAIEPRAIEIMSGRSGRLITAIPSSEFRARNGVPYRVIHRADLQAILAAAVRANPSIRLELGATVPQYLAQGDALLVRVQRPGTIDVVTAEALIAADGVWSSFRDRIAGGAKPAPTGRTAWRALIPADVARDLVAMDRTGLWLGRNAHLVHYPVAAGAAVNVVAIVEEDWEKPGWNAPGDRDELIRRLESWPAAARKLIAAPIAWQKYAILSVDPKADWVDGRLALLGDAAHAMAPFLAQGAGMAMEDAVVLAGSLRGAREIPAALKAYETARRERVVRVAEAATETGRQYHIGGVLAFARDAALRFRGPQFILDRTDWIYRWQPPETANV